MSTASRVPGSQLPLEPMHTHRKASSYECCHQESSSPRLWPQGMLGLQEHAPFYGVHGMSNRELWAQPASECSENCMTSASHLQIVSHSLNSPTAERTHLMWALHIKTLNPNHWSAYTSTEESSKKSLHSFFSVSLY